MVTIDKITYSGSNYHKLIKLAKKFAAEYDGQTKVDDSKSHYRKTIEQDQYRFINVDGKTVGFINMDIMGATGPDFRSINIIYVHPEYRHQGIATAARAMLLNETSECPVIATVVTATRLADNSHYWLSQGFKYWTISPHNTFAPGSNPANAENSDQILLQIFAVLPKGDVPDGYFKSIEETANAVAKEMSKETA